MCCPEAQSKLRNKSGGHRGVSKVTDHLRWDCLRKVSCEQVVMSKAKPCGTEALEVRE